MYEVAYRIGRRIGWPLGTALGHVLVCASRRSPRLRDRLRRWAVS